MCRDLETLELTRSGRKRQKLLASNDCVSEAAIQMGCLYTAVVAAHCMGRFVVLPKPAVLRSAGKHST